jgi:dCTP deaminase
VILSDGEISERVSIGSLTIKPFNEAQVQPASYDVTLGSEFMLMRPHQSSAIFPWDKQTSLFETVRLMRPLEKFTLHPGKFCLARTAETFIIPDDLAAQVGGKSSLGRLGLIVHATAGFIDPGFTGSITLELGNVGELPIVLEQDMPIGQLVFTQLSRPALRPYSGRYQNQISVTESRYWHNYHEESDQ